MVYQTTPFSMTLKDPQTQILRSDRSLRLNISEMAKDTAIVTMEGEACLGGAVGSVTVRAAWLR